MFISLVFTLLPGTYFRLCSAADGHEGDGKGDGKPGECQHLQAALGHVPATAGPAGEAEAGESSHASSASPFQVDRNKGGRPSLKAVRMGRCDSAIMINCKNSFYVGGGGLALIVEEKKLNMPVSAGRFTRSIHTYLRIRLYTH